MSIPAPPPGGGSNLEGVELVVVGGGLLGGTVARVAAAAGARVTVASPSQRPHAGVWRRYRAGVGAFPTWIPRDARIVVAIAPPAGQDPSATWNAATQRFVASLARGGRRVVLCGPTAGAPAFDSLATSVGEAQVVRLSALLGVEDRPCWPIVRALREGRVARIPRADIDTWALYAEDAARVILRFEEGPVTLRGPERLSFEAMATTIAERYGGSWSRGWGRAGWEAADLALLAAQRELPDSWDEARSGPRTTLRAWADRLPGPRRRR